MGILVLRDKLIKNNFFLFFIAVSDIQCAFWSDSNRNGRASITPTTTSTNNGYKDMLSARLRKPEGFKGTPLFADDRAVDPLTDPVCQIKPDLTDVTRLTYNLMITDFNRCGVLKRNVSEVFYLFIHH